MKTALKIIGMIVGVIVLAIGVVVAGIYIITNNAINNTREAVVSAVEIPDDADSVAWGQHVATIRGCGDCHTPNFGGQLFIDGGPLGQFYAANLTPGQGSAVSAYTDEDWVRAIRYGLGPDKKPLLFMPSHEFYPLSDRDLAALIAFLKQVPPVDNVLPGTSVGPLARVLYLAGQFDLIPADKIDLTGPHPAAPEPGVTVEYGQYLAIGCVGCHGPGYSGGVIPGVPPGWPAAANLTPGGELAEWNEADFIQTIRTGVTPVGYELPKEYMPWPAYAQMTDEELQAVWLFLQSLPAKANGNR